MRCCCRPVVSSVNNVKAYASGGWQETCCHPWSPSISRAVFLVLHLLDPLNLAWGGGAEHRRSVAEVSMFSVLCSEWLQWVVEKRRWEKMGGSVLKDTQSAPEWYRWCCRSLPGVLQRLKWESNPRLSTLLSTRSFLSIKEPELLSFGLFFFFIIPPFAEHCTEQHCPITQSVR